MMTSLSLPASSPSLFQHVQSPNDKEEPGWAIEQMAQLHPAHIDVTPYHKQLLGQKYDPHKEMQVQTAIDRFFSSEKIVPSPWSAGGPRTVALASCLESPLTASAPPAVRHCGTQTALTLPAQLPAELERALAPYLCCAAADQSQSRDDDSVMSTSTLRRKLLFHNTNGDEPTSNDVSMADPNGSVYHFPGTPDKGHLLPTSPPSPGRSRTSVPHRPDVDSPAVSPICKSMMASPSTSSIKSQGLAKIRYPSSDISDPSDDDDDDVGGASAVAAAELPSSLAEDSVPQDTGYHSTLASLPSLSARHLAVAENSQLARLLGSGSASMLHSTRLESRLEASELPCYL
ncbi:protein aurora borealis-like [Pollicipes pollicipes]|uniref:protein aurora borealis-like n=1 Tax=Pollicipes pollicipes TaxID=41117 RepID=UPI0018850E11|nr:protein aurora borealis-like [Pollicipes pollicipes]